MEIKRIQSFLATINGVEFTNERRFDVVEYILHLIEYKFGIEATIDAGANAITYTAYGMMEQYFHEKMETYRK